MKVLSTVPRVLPRNNCNSFRATAKLARRGIKGNNKDSGSKGRRGTGTVTWGEWKCKDGGKSFSCCWLFLSFQKGPDIPDAPLQPSPCHLPFIPQTRSVGSVGITPFIPACLSVELSKPFVNEWLKSDQSPQHRSA